MWGVVVEGFLGGFGGEVWVIYEYVRFMVEVEFVNSFFLCLFFVIVELEGF